MPGDFIIHIPGSNSASGDAPAIKEEKPTKTRDELITEYMETVTSSLNRVTAADWRGDFTSPLKATNGSEDSELEIRKRCVEQLKKIDSESDEKKYNIVTTSQMTILGMLAPCSYRIWKMLKDMKQGINYSAEEIKKKMFVEEDNVYKFRWLTGTYRFDDMNRVFKKFNIRSPDSLRHLLVQSSGETGFGNNTLQDGKAVNETGAGYLQLTSLSMYKEFAEYLNVPKIADFTGIGKGEAKNNLDKGPGLVSISYPWESAGWLWTRTDGSGEKSFDYYIVQEGADINKVTCKMANGSIKSKSLYRGDNFDLKQVLFAITEGLF